MNMKKIKDGKSLRSQVKEFLDSAFVDADFPFTYNGKDCLLRVRPDSRIPVALYIEEDRKLMLEDNIEDLDMDFVTEAVMSTLQKRINDTSLKRVKDKLVEYIDEDTGEIIEMEEEDLPDMSESDTEDVPDEIIIRDKELRDQIHELDSQASSVAAEIQDIDDQLRNLEIDQEEEIGLLNNLGKFSEGEQVAQEYGQLQTELTKHREVLVTKFNELIRQLEPLEDELWKLWSSIK